MQTLRGEIKNTSLDLQKQRHYGTSKNTPKQAVTENIRWMFIEYNA